MRERISEAKEHLSDAVVVVKKHHLLLTVASGFIVNLAKIPLNASGNQAGFTAACTVDSFAVFFYVCAFAGIYKIVSSDLQGEKGKEEDQGLLSNSRRSLFRQVVDTMVDADFVNVASAFMFAGMALFAIVLDSIFYFAPAQEDPSGPSDPAKINSLGLYGANIAINIGYFLAAAPSVRAGTKQLFSSNR